MIGSSASLIECFCDWQEMLFMIDRGQLFMIEILDIPHMMSPHVMMPHDSNVKILCDCRRSSNNIFMNIIYKISIE